MKLTQEKDVLLAWKQSLQKIKFRRRDHIHERSRYLGVFRYNTMSSRTCFILGSFMKLLVFPSSPG